MKEGKGYDLLLRYQRKGEELMFANLKVRTRLIILTAVAAISMCILGFINMAGGGKGFYQSTLISVDPKIAALTVAKFPHKICRQLLGRILCICPVLIFRVDPFQQSHNIFYLSLNLCVITARLSKKFSRRSALFPWDLSQRRY